MSEDIRGMSELIGKIERMENVDRYASIIQRLCLKVEREAKLNCPRKTGHLKRSITHTIEKQTSSKVVGIVGTNVEYAPYVEFGTGKFAQNGQGRKTPWAYTDPETGETIWTAGQKPQPFLHPALDKYRAEILKELKGAAIIKGMIDQ